MTLEEFKESIEKQFEHKIQGLEQKIENKDYEITKLKEHIKKLEEAGKDLYLDALEVRTKLEKFVENELWGLPHKDNRFDDNVSLFKVEEAQHD